MGRYDRSRTLAALDPVADRTHIVRTMLELEFPWDMMRSLELALFRTFAVPTIGRLLDRTAEFTEHAQRRYDDTMLLLYHIWLGRPDGTEPERAAGVEQLNRIHGHYRISNDDFRYTLTTFVVIPIRWLRRFGWRSPSAVEVAAWTNVMRDMGAAMGITGMPESFDGFVALLDAYEAEHFAYEPGAERVARATLDLMVGWYPAPLRPALRAMVPALLDDPVLTAVGLPIPGPRRRRIAESGVRARARAVRILPGRPEHRPFRPDVRSYVDEPAVDQIGPAALLRRAPESVQQ
jgi:hypothetical protein